MSPRPTLQAFAGAWQITRRIEDQYASQVITGSGQGVFAPDPEVPGGMIYDESLQMQFPNGNPGQAPGQVPGQARSKAAMQATRRYLWHPQPEGAQVLFSDGRPFHTVSFADKTPQDRHYCDPDIYDVTYDFRVWPCWSAVWTVQGPKKRYRMESQFIRL